MSAAANRIETAGAATAGPVVINLLGYDVPVLAAILSIAGVILASLIAPPPARQLTRWQGIALVALLCILVLGLVISDPNRSLLVSTCWAIAIGYAGLPIIQAIRDRIFPQVADLAGGQASSTGDSSSEQP